MRLQTAVLVESNEKQGRVRNEEERRADRREDRRRRRRADAAEDRKTVHRAVDQQIQEHRVEQRLRQMRLQLVKDECDRRREEQRQQNGRQHADFGKDDIPAVSGDEERVADHEGDPAGREPVHG